MSCEQNIMSCFVLPGLSFLSDGTSGLSVAIPALPVSSKLSALTIGAVPASCVRSSLALRRQESMLTGYRSWGLAPRRNFFGGESCARLANASGVMEAGQVSHQSFEFSVQMAAPDGDGSHGVVEALDGVDVHKTPARHASKNGVSRETFHKNMSKGIGVAGVGTAAVQGGERHGRPKTSDSVVTPVVHSAMYWFETSQEVIDYNEGRYRSYEYGRYGNPTTRTAELKIAAMENAEDCLVSSSGMCSATTMLLALMQPGGHIITTSDCYRRTRQFIASVLSKFGVTTTVIDPSDYETLQRTLEERGKGGVTLFFSETPTNPYLRVIDIARVSAMCREYGTLVCIDSTFATPVNQRALDLGADLVLHSATKFLAGHNDVMCGALAGKASVIAKVRDLHGILGGVLDPHAAYLLIRGMKTLQLRVQRQNHTALQLAKLLESHPKIARVHYPALESHPDHEIAVRQMNGFGGVVSFEVAGDLNRAMALIDALRIPYIAPSLGGVESLVEQPTVMSYWDQSPEARAKIGIRDNLVRYSCGIEDTDDLLDDMLHALEAI